MQHLQKDYSAENAMVRGVFLAQVASPRSTSRMLCDMAFPHSKDPTQIPLSFAMS